MLDADRGVNMTDSFEASTHQKLQNAGNERIRYD